MNQTELKILAFGHATVDEHWEGLVAAPSFSQLHFIQNGSFQITVKEKTVALSEGH